MAQKGCVVFKCRVCLLVALYLRRPSSIPASVTHTQASHACLRVCSGFYTVVELPSTIIVFVLCATMREQRKRTPLLAKELREGGAGRR